VPEFLVRLQLHRRLGSHGHIQADADGVEVPTLRISSSLPCGHVVLQVLQVQLHAQRMSEGFQVFNGSERMLQFACAPGGILVAEVEHMDSTGICSATSSARFTSSIGRCADFSTSMRFTVGPDCGSTHCQSAAAGAEWLRPDWSGTRHRCRGRRCVGVVKVGRAAKSSMDSAPRFAWLPGGG